MNNWAILFDMDGVLVNNHTFHIKSWQVFGHQHDFHISEANFNRHIAGHSTQEAIEWVFGNGLDNDKILELSEQKEAIYREIYKPYITEVPGLSKLLKDLMLQGITCAVATSALPENVAFTLTELGLKDYFKTCVCSTDVALAKPAPDVYLKAAERLGVAPQNCVVIEDSRAGIKAGKAAGCQVVALTTSLTAQQLYGAQPNFIVKDFTELSITLLRQIKDLCA